MVKYLKRTYIGLILLFLYAPIVTLIVFSFNASKSRAQWSGFSLKWYNALFNDPEILRALYVTLFVAVISALIATLIGTLAAVGIHAMKPGPKKFATNLSYLPMLTPDIVTGIALMMLFSFIAPAFALIFGHQWSMVKMIIAHVSFNIPYVVFSVLPKLRQMNKYSYEAALDLGATPTQALIRVVLPEIMPGIFTGALLAFTLSVDDFVISYFVSDVQNLSVLIYSMARRGIQPTINALSALMFVVVLALLLVINRRSSLQDHEQY